mgnify:FL=1
MCSFVNNSACMAPLEYPVMFDSWYECSRAAHQESIKIMNKMGYKEVNDYQIAMKYNCRKVTTY